MDLKSIQEKLNSEFQGTDRKLVFWYDDNAEFAEEVDSIDLDNAQVYRLTPDNLFYTKYFFEIVDKTTNYLVYAPFSKPADRDNHLADTVYYSKLFYADKISLIMLDLNIPDRFKERLNSYPKFFNYNKYLDPFAALGIENYNEEIIDIGVLSVLCGIKTPNFDEILRALMISGDFENNKYLAIFNKMGILPVFWQLCKKYYGYSEENPTLEKLVITLLITYTAHGFSGELPKVWSYYVSSKKNDVAVFVSNFMNNMLYKEQYIALSEKISLKIKAKDHISKYDLKSFINCDTFPVFDELILGKLVEGLNNEGVKEQGLIPNISSIVEGRLKKYYVSIFMNEYKTIEAALKLIDQLELPKADENIVDKYVKSLHLIDTHYRKFYYYYDKLENNSNFLELRHLIENLYTNAFLSKLSIAWGDKLENYKSISEIPHTKQYDFYRLFVAPTAKRECTVVIISDALRFECAAELNTLFNDSVQNTSELDYMISCVPSSTGLGMAALLPHKQISFTENYEVLVDRQPSVSTEQRQKILERHNPATVACLYSDLISLGREDVRKLLTGKELIYIYHNQIDARGDNSSTENEVFAACEETFEEIKKLVKKLTVDKSITNYLITADHGFIYKRDKIGGQNYVHGGTSLQELIVPIIKLKTARYKKETGYVEVILVSLSRKVTNLISYLDFLQSENVSDALSPVVMKIYFINDAGETISNETIIYADKKKDPPEKRMFKEKFTFRNRNYSKSEKYYLVMIDHKTDVELERYEFTIDIAFSNF